MDVSNILEDFKNDILSYFIYNMDALHEKKRKEEEDQALSIFSLYGEKGTLSRDVH